MRSAFAILLMLLLLVPALALDPRTIAPGVCIGHVRLREDANEATRGLGKPHDADSASGVTWAIWYGNALNSKPAELDMYIVHDESGLHYFVEQVRVTSPYFRTVSGVGAGSTLAQVRQAFPYARLIVSREPSLPRTVFYDDKAAGVAFEFARGTKAGACVSVLIHPRGRAAGNEYGSWHGTY